jgi:endonuclease/exonuclease/phosphatase family metal-dependent hydrolase
VSKVRVLSYNVRGLRDDVRALTEVVRRCRPDVLIVQEAPSLLRWRSRCAALARECGLVYVAGGRTAGGNLLLVNQRVTVHGVGEHRIRQPLHDPIRGIVSATLGVGRTRFGVVGMHLSLSAAGREREVREVLAVVRSFAGLPVVVAGDLNEEPVGPSWQTLAEAGLRDLGADPERAAESTFPAGHPRARIDAVFVTDDRMSGTEYGVPGDPALRVDLVRATDHLPVLAALDLG